MGKFNNKISAEYNPPRKWILERALSYTNPDIDEDALERVGVKVIGSKIAVKKDFVTDLASVPRVCWAFIAPWGGDDKVVISKAKKASDDVFHMAMKDAEPPVSGWKIAAAYYAVRMFGRWSIIPREED